MSSTLTAVLRRLGDTQRHSLDDLGRALGVPGEQLRHALDALEDAGVDLERDASTVRAPAVPDLLDRLALEHELASTCACVTLELLDECESTNAVMMRRAAAGAPSGTALACELQLAGRGRRGTAWLAPPGGSLASTLLWRMPRAGGALAGVSLAAGVACVRALERCGVPGVQLKWPNDVVHGGRKLGGILVEAAPDGSGSAVVCGVGINTRLSPRTRAAIGQPVTDIASVSASPPSRTTLLAALLIELADALQRFAADGFAPFRDAWLRHHAHQNRPVTVRFADQRSIAGRALGIADDGALLVEHAGGIEHFHSGDVSLRAA